MEEWTRDNNKKHRRGKLTHRMNKIKEFLDIFDENSTTKEITRKRCINHDAEISDYAVRKFEDFVEGVSTEQVTDELTGISSTTIKDQSSISYDKNLKPMVKLIDDKGDDLNIANSNMPAHYILPSKSIVSLTDGMKIGVGDTIARTPRETSGTRDITGGLPRVADLFEARQPKYKAELAEKTGVVSFGKETKGKRRLEISYKDEDGKEAKHTQMLIKTKLLNVFEGAKVEQGEIISEGELDPHDILQYRGITELTEHIVKEVQGVYRLEGVSFFDKHIDIYIENKIKHRNY